MTADPAGPLPPPPAVPPPVTVLHEHRRLRARERPTDRRTRRSAVRPERGAATGELDPAGARHVVAWLVRAAHEVAAGVRPYPQLAPLLAPTIAGRLGAQLRRSRIRPDARLTIHSVHVAPPTPSGALEATAIVEHEDRVRAVAVRLERHRERWRATELTGPEAGYRALPTASDAGLSCDEPDAFDVAAAEAAARERLRVAASASEPRHDRAAGDHEGVVVAFSSRRGSA